MPKITLDDLARIVKNGFNGVDKRLDNMDKRFDRLEKENESSHSEFRGNIGLIWQELKEINKKLDGLSERTFEDSELAFKEIMQMKKRVGFLEEEVKKLKLSH